MKGEWETPFSLLSFLWLKDLPSFSFYRYQHPATRGTESNIAIFAADEKHRKWDCMSEKLQTILYPSIPSYWLGDTNTTLNVQLRGYQNIKYFNNPISTLSIPFPPQLKQDHQVMHYVQSMQMRHARASVTLEIC